MTFQFLSSLSLSSSLFALSCAFYHPLFHLLSCTYCLTHFHCCGKRSLPPPSSSFHSSPIRSRATTHSSCTLWPRQTQHKKCYFKLSTTPSTRWPLAMHWRVAWRCIAAFEMLLPTVGSVSTQACEIICINCSSTHPATYDAPRLGFSKNFHL